MKRLFRWLLRILVALVIAGLVFYIVVLPSIVERVAVSTLEAMGLEDVRLEVRGLSLRHAQLANVAAGEGDRLFVGAIGLRYTLPDLLRGRVDAVELTGVEVDIRVKDGELDLGPIATLLEQEAREGEFPAGRIELRASTLFLDIDGKPLSIPVSGFVVRQEGGKLRLVADLASSLLKLRVTGTVDPESMDADLAFHGRAWDAGALLDALRQGRTGLAWSRQARHIVEGGQPPIRGGAAGPGYRPLTIGGDVRFSGTVRHTAGSTRLALRATAMNAQVRRETDEPFGSSGLVVLVASAQIDGGTVSKLQTDVTAMGLKAAAAPVKLGDGDDVNVVFGWDGQEASLVVAIEDVASCDAKFTAQAPRLLSWLQGERSGLTVRFGWDAEQDTRLLREILGDVVDALHLPGLLTTKGGGTVRIERDDVGALSWRFEAPDIRVRLTDENTGSVRFDTHTTADVRLALAATQEQATVRILSGTVLELDADGLRILPTAARDSHTSDPTLRAEVNGEEAMASVRFRTPLDWSVHAPEIDVTANIRKITGGGVIIRDLAARTRLAIDATPKQALVSLLPGARLSVGTVRLDDAAMSLQPLENAMPLLKAELERGAAVSIEPQTLGWSLSATDAAVIVPGIIATCTEPRAKVEGLSLAAKLDVEAAPTKLKATLQPGAQLVLKSLATDLVRIEHEDSEPLLRLATHDDPATFEASPAKRTLEWTARVPRVALALAAKGASLPDGPSIEVPRLQLNVAAEATHERVTLKGLPDSRLSLAGATLELGGEALRLDAARFALAMDPANALAELLLAEPYPTVRVAARMQSASPVKTALGTRVGGTVREVEIGLEGSTDGRTADVRAMLQLRGTDASAKQVVDKESLDVALRDWSAEAVVSGKGPIDALLLEAELTLESGKAPKALTASMGPIAASLGEAALKAKATLDPRAGLEGDATLTVAGGEAQHKDAGLTVRGIAATVPLALGERRSAKGTFSVESIHIADADLPGLKGTFESADRQTQIHGDWPIVPGATLSFDAALDFRLPLPRGELTATLPRFVFDDSNQPSELFGILEGVEVGGAVALDARVRLAQGLLDPLVTLRLEDVSIASEAYDASLEGISTKLTFNRLSPLATPGSQRIRMTRGHVGKLHVRDGAIAFRLEDIDSLFVEQLEWGWAGGRIYTHALRLNLFDPKPDLVLYAERLELSELLALVAEGEVTGTGSLYGRLPVAIDWPKVSYGRGFLYATPGRGRLKFNRATLDSILSLGHPSLNSVAARSLEEFEYSEFQADFMGEDPDKLARVRAFGKSLSAKHPWEWLLDVRVHGFDRLLNEAIIIKRGTDRFTGSLETLK